MTWLLDHLVREWNLIIQAPIIFGFVCVLFAFVSAGLMWRIFQERFKHQKALIELLQQELSLQPALANPPIELPAKTEVIAISTPQQKLKTTGAKIIDGEQNVYCQTKETGTLKLCVVEIVNTIQTPDLPVMDINGVRALLFLREIERGPDQHDIVWGARLGTDFSHVTFKIGLPRKLIIAVKDAQNSVFAVENDHIEPEYNKGEYYAPKRRKLTGDTYMVMVQLLRGDDLVKQFNCRLRVRPHFDICFIRSSSSLLRDLF